MYVRVTKRERLTLSRRVLAIVGCAMLAASLVAVPPVEAAEAGPLVSVIVRAESGAPGAAAAVEAVGGRVTQSLDIVGGVSAEVPHGALTALAGHEDVWQISPNSQVSFEHKKHKRKCKGLEGDAKRSCKSWVHNKHKCSGKAGPAATRCKRWQTNKWKCKGLKGAAFKKCRRAIKAGKNPFPPQPTSPDGLLEDDGSGSDSHSGATQDAPAADDPDRIQEVTGSDDVNELGLTGKDVTVALLDTGVFDHPDLRGRILHCEDLSGEFDEPEPFPTPSPDPTLPTPLPTLPTPLPTVSIPDPSLTLEPLPTPVPTELPTPLPSIVPTSLPTVLPLPRAQAEPPVAEPTGPGVCNDTFGHGTFMAGLIAGDGTLSDGAFHGAAPEADLVAVKAAGFDGSTDISKILAGIQWVVAHKDTYDIRVLNLSLGSDSDQDYRLSPLNYAVERAWQEGIVVVVSAGNSGPDPETVLKPGDDPYVVTVGASNDEGTFGIEDDRVAGFSSRGVTRSNALAKPDIVAPGVHTVSLRSPGSAIDQNHEHARVDGAYFRGSGTSMSAATVSGIVALILEVHPEMTPDEIKYALMATARPIAETDPTAVGSGLVDAVAAATSPPEGLANQGLVPSTGLGSIQADRGSIDAQVVTPQGGVDFAGEYVAQSDPSTADPNNPAGLLPWVGATYTTTGWDPASWNGTQWKTEEWAGTQWKGTQWKATVWNGTQWKGTQWKNVDWEGTQWKDVDWDGTSWKGTQWKSAWYAVAWD